MARTWWPAAVALAGMLLGVPAGSRAAVLASPSSEVAARLVALEAIPAAHRQAVETLLADHPLVIRIVPKPFRTTTRVYDFLLGRLPFAATLSRTLELGPYIVESVGPGAYWSTDQQGLQGTVRELVVSDGVRVYLAEGRYDGRWLRGVTGRAVVAVRYEPVALNDGEPAIRNTVYCLVRLDDSILQAVARIIGSVLQGLMEGKLDRAVRTAKALTERLAAEPQAVYQAIATADSVTHAERLEFARWFLQP